jgi:hypothetical protein
LALVVAPVGDRRTKRGTTLEEADSIPTMPIFSSRHCFLSVAGEAWGGTREPTAEQGWHQRHLDAVDQGAIKIPLDPLVASGHTLFL